MARENQLENFEESLPERLDRLISRNKLTPCIVVFPDCFTSMGGNQYINSKAIGQYADYLTQEIIPFVETNLGLLHLESTGVASVNLQGVTGHWSTG